MKIAYIAHPIGGDVYGNLDKISRIVLNLNTIQDEYVPFVPYWADVQSMNDNKQEHRKRGIANNEAILRSGMVDEIWLYGDRISPGMAAEIHLAHQLDIPVRPKTPETEEAYQRMLNVGL